MAIHRQCLCLYWVHFHFPALAHILSKQLHSSLQCEFSMSACERKATVVLSHWTAGLKILLIHWYILPSRLIYNLTKYEFINCNIVLPVNIQKNNIFLNTCLVPELTRLCTGTYWARCSQGLSLIFLDRQRPPSSPESTEPLSFDAVPEPNSAICRVQSKTNVLNQIPSWTFR